MEDGGAVDIFCVCRRNQHKLDPNYLIFSCHGLSLVVVVAVGCPPALGAFCVHVMCLHKATRKLYITEIIIIGPLWVGT